MYNLQINNQTVNLDNSFNVTLSYNSIDVLNPINRSGGFTYTLNIPRTTNNNKVFSHIDDIDVLDKFQNNKYDATLQFANQTIIVGKFYLDSITDFYYQGSIVSDTINWADKIPDVNINELTGYTATFPYTSETLSTFSTIQAISLTGNSDNINFNFPFIGRGNYNYATLGQAFNSIESDDSAGVTTKFTCEDIIPAYYYLNSIKNIFTYAGLNVECSLFNDSEFKKLIIPYVGTDKFNYNWGRIGDARAEYVFSADGITESYFNNFTAYNYQYSSGTLNYFPGYRYLVNHEGRIKVYGERFLGVFTWDIRIYRATVEDPLNAQLLVQKTPASINNSVIEYEGDFSIGDIIYIVGTAGNNGTSQLKCMDNVYIHFTEEDVELNYQKALPKVKCLDWIKNFLSYYGLYPFYNAINNTVYILTLNEFLKIDNDFNINGINSKTVKAYNSSSLNLKYTFDTKEALVTENEFDYITNSKTGKDIQTLFSPSSKRDYLVTFKSGATYSSITTSITSIASQDQINLDRLTLNLVETLDYTDWSNSTSYSSGDKVKYGDKYYRAYFASSGQTPSSSNAWIEDFLFQYNTDVDYDYIPRILKTVVPQSNNGKLIKSDKGNYLFFMEADFDSTLDMEYIYNNYYINYKSLINNRTSIIEGNAYIPIQKFIDYFNFPVEVDYFKDRYIILGISNYDPVSEVGKVKIIKKVTYTDSI